MSSQNYNHDIICIGASAGGVEALLTLMSGLPGNFPASIFVVVHMPAEPPSILHDILHRNGQLKVIQAQDGAFIKPGVMYVAQNDKHLVIEEGFLRVIHGPKENRFRPAIDPLFRSAALVYGPRAVGVILSGLLDDGTSGLVTIKEAGGIAIVQDPEDAMYPSMPKSALSRVKADYTVPISLLADVLKQVVEMPIGQNTSAGIHKRTKLETDIVKMDGDVMGKTQVIGKPSGFACPECHGTLWEVEDPNMLRFRCHVGHAYTAASLQADQSENLEDKLWAVVAALDENAMLLRRMADENINSDSMTPDELEEQAQKADENSQLLRSIIVKQKK
ncbi:MAG TPA: chemotaxis protein CheB [Patescibacteria group bacterium]|nr:chemotaxis protein CheB [Patescibacteria group bacterium]